jgi:hypothetical protein
LLSRAGIAIPVSHAAPANFASHFRVVQYPSED